MAINLKSPSAFTSGTLVADTVAATGGSNDSISKMTISGGVTVSAALEVQSTEGALLIPRMTSTQRDALTASDGMEIYNTTTSEWNYYNSGAWNTSTSSNLVNQVSVTADTAAVIGMFVTPVTILPAQGANEVIIVHKVAVELSFVGAAFTSGGATYLQYGTTGASTDVASDTIPATFVQQAADFVISKDGLIGSTNGLSLGTVLANQPLTLTNDTGAFADGGTSELVINVWYSVINLV